MIDDKQTNKKVFTLKLIIIMTICADGSSAGEVTTYKKRIEKGNKKNSASILINNKRNADGKICIYTIFRI